MNYVFRLTKGQDLKKEIVKFAKENDIEAGVIKCCVGCVYEVSIRLAGGETFMHKTGDYEIVSVTGTISKNGCHIHMSFSDKEGNTIGGHLKDGTLVNSTAEVCIEKLTDYSFNREFDNNTGYKELVIQKVSD